MTTKELAERRLAALLQAEHRSGRNPARDVPPAASKQRGVKQPPGPDETLGDLGRVISCLRCAVPEELVHLRHQDFAGAGWLIEGSPGPDGEPLLFASDNASPDPGESRVVYRARELRALRGLSAGAVRDLHGMKRDFATTLEVN